MFSELLDCPLFVGMNREEIEHYVQDSRSRVTHYKKDEMIFLQDDVPNYMMILMSGKVAVCSDSSAGKRSIIALIENPGELFGEVFLFLNHREYEHYAQAMSDTTVLQIPKNYFFQMGDQTSSYQEKIIANMLQIFAQKTYYLNQRLNILSCGSLRQKLARIILKNAHKKEKVQLNMNREELADFLNAARPSLSRELMKMQDEGLIAIDRQEIKILDMEALAELM